jgi:hypothetical protein
MAAFLGIPHAVVLKFVRPWYPSTIQRYALWKITPQLEKK